MTPTPAVTLQDADPDAWKAGRRPDPTAEELALLGLAKLYAKADREVQERAGVTSIETYKRLTGTRQALVTELLEAAGKYRGREGDSSRNQPSAETGPNSPSSPISPRDLRQETTGKAGE